MDIDTLVSGNIDTSIEYNFDLVQIWDKIVFSNILENELKTKEISLALANSYIGDIYGLLGNELNIPSSMWYPITRLNGYESSIDYDGRTWLVIPNPDVMEDILEKIKNYISEIENE